MSRKGNSELTMVIPQLNKREACALKNSLIEAKKTYAPHAKASIVIGKKENFSKIVQKCNHQLDLQKIS